MNPHSESLLAALYPPFADKLRSADAKLSTLGTHLYIVSGLRTASEQNALYAQGRTAPGHIVTNARAGYSMHNYGLAADIAPFVSGESGPLNWKPETEQYQAAVRALKDEGLVWGGDWVSFKDMDHFQMPGLPNTPNQRLRLAYGQGTPAELHRIWDLVPSGIYAS